MKLELAGVMRGEPHDKMVALLAVHGYSVERTVRAVLDAEEEMEEDEDADGWRKDESVEMEEETKSNGRRMDGIAMPPSSAHMDADVIEMIPSPSTPLSAAASSSAAAATAAPVPLPPPPVSVVTIHLRSDSVTDHDSSSSHSRHRHRRQENEEEEVICQMKVHRKFSKLFDKFTALCKRPLEFWWGSRRVRGEDTPAGLGMGMGGDGVSGSEIQMEARAPVGVKRRFVQAKLDDDDDEIPVAAGGAKPSVAPPPPDSVAPVAVANGLSPSLKRSKHSPTPDTVTAAASFSPFATSAAAASISAPPSAVSAGSSFISTLAANAASFTASLAAPTTNAAASSSSISLSSSAKPAPTPVEWPLGSVDFILRQRHQFTRTTSHRDGTLSTRTERSQEPRQVYPTLSLMFKDVETQGYLTSLVCVGEYDIGEDEGEEQWRAVIDEKEHLVSRNNLVARVLRFMSDSSDSFKCYAVRSESECFCPGCDRGQSRKKCNCVHRLCWHTFRVSISLQPSVREVHLPEANAFLPLINIHFQPSISKHLKWFEKGPSEKGYRVPLNLGDTLEMSVRTTFTRPVERAIKRKGEEVVEDIIADDVDISPAPVPAPALHSSSSPPPASASASAAPSPSGPAHSSPSSSNASATATSAASSSSSARSSSISTSRSRRGRILPGRRAKSNRISYAEEEEDDEEKKEEDEHMADDEEFKEGDSHADDGDSAVGSTSAAASPSIAPPPAAAASAASSSPSGHVSSAASGSHKPSAADEEKCLDEHERIRRRSWGLPPNSEEEDDLSCPATDELLNLSLEELSHRCGLNITLRDYQQQTVLWALKQECSGQSIADPYWDMIDVNGRKMWYSPLFQTIRRMPLPDVVGGFISEEMGLGKTIEILSLIHLNPAGNPLELRPPYSNPASSSFSFSSFARSDGRVLTKATLIIAPTSLVGQWFSEISSRSHPDHPLKVLCWYGSNRTQNLERIAEYDVVLTSFGVISVELGLNKRQAATTGMAYPVPDPSPSSVLEKLEWHRVVIDESHTLKSKTKQWYHVQSIPSRRRWLLTGTPLVTCIDDIINQFSFFSIPGLSESKLLQAIRWHCFGREPSRGFQASRSHHGSLLDSIMSSYSPAQSWSLLHTMFRRSIMRHKKNQHFNGRPNLISLPRKHFETLVVYFTPTERASYDKLWKFARSKFDDFLKAGVAVARTIQVMQLLLPLRQACSAGEVNMDDVVKQLQQFEEAQKARAEAEKLAAEEKEAEYKQHAAFNYDSECPICLEVIEDCLMTPCRHAFCSDCINKIAVGRMEHECPLCRRPFTRKELTAPPPRPPPPPAPPSSAIAAAAASSSSSSSPSVALPSSIFFDSKVQALLRQLRVLRSKDSAAKSLVFSQFTKTIHILKERLQSAGFNPVVIEGSMSMTQRKTALERFINDPDCTVFVMSIRSGAVGLTLTAATHVFLMEPSINPALTQQAINRVHRVGQTRDVFVHHLIVSDSVEQRLLDLTMSKLQTTTEQDGEDDSSAAEKMATARATGHDSYQMRVQELTALFK